jgi:hypothetical protein
LWKMMQTVENAITESRRQLISFYMHKHGGLCSRYVIVL